MSIAENIKKIRETYSLTQAQLGDIAGVSDKAVSTWEGGTAEPRMGAVQKIARHFKIPISAVVDDDGAAATSPEERELLDNFRQLNDEGQDILVEQSKTMVASGRYIKSDSHGLDKEA